MPVTEERSIVFKCHGCQKSFSVLLAEGLPAVLESGVADMLMGDFLPSIGWSLYMNTVDLRVELMCSEKCRAVAAADARQKRDLREAALNPNARQPGLVLPGQTKPSSGPLVES